jgi:serine protease
VPSFTQAADSLEARVIVKLKASSMLKQIQAAGRVETLGTRMGLRAHMVSQPGRDLHVMRASGLTSEALAARLAGDADVEYAVPDRIKKISALPNDPLYGFQWYLQAPDTTRLAATNAQAAWDMTSGSSKVVVAVVDSGVRFDHEDLSPAWWRATTSSPMISMPTMARAAAMPTPPTRGTTSRRPTATTPPCRPVRHLSTQGSSWHGTQVAGIGRRNQQLPGYCRHGGATRVLPCAYSASAVASTRTSSPACAGPPARVPGVPATPPGPGHQPEPPPERHLQRRLSPAIAEIRQAGALIVAAAGNETSPSKSLPTAPACWPSPASATWAPRWATRATGGGRHQRTGRQLRECPGRATLPVPFINPINQGSTSPTANGYTGTTTSPSAPASPHRWWPAPRALMLAANPALTKPMWAR